MPSMCFFTHDATASHLRKFGAGLRTGASIPQQRLSPNLTSTPSLAFRHPTPQTIFDHFIRNFVQFVCVFSVNFGSWQSGIKPDNGTKIKINIYKWGLAKYIACLHFLSGG